MEGGGRLHMTRGVVVVVAAVVGWREIARFILDNWVRELQPMAALQVQLIRAPCKAHAGNN